MLATTRELANKYNLTYPQTRYLIDQGVINLVQTKGQKWEVNEQEQWLLDLAVLMRENRISVGDILDTVREIRKGVAPLAPFSLLRTVDDSVSIRHCIYISWDKSNWAVYIGKKALVTAISERG